MKSYTCMKCFKLGKRKRNPVNNGEKSLRHDLELQKKMKQRVAEIQKEMTSKGIPAWKDKEKNNVR